jgi:alkaline phosphatase
MHRLVISLFCLLALAPEACLSQQSSPTVDVDSEPQVSQPEELPDCSNPNDRMCVMQNVAIKEGKTPWGHWGNQPDQYSSWTNHSNRLIPLYTFGITLDALREEGSVYADPERLQQLYGRIPAGTVNPTAVYYDQTDVYRLQMAAVEAGYSNIILIIFDGMDWQTTRAAALYKQRQLYTSGRGTGLSFQDDRRARTDFGLLCTSPRTDIPTFDVNAQTVVDGDTEATGGYDPLRGGEFPWHEASGREYLMGTDREQPHTVTDSASAATSIYSGIKTYNGGINVSVDGTHVTPISRRLQAEQKVKVGLVTSVPVSHATIAACYANNVTRKDYQDISRDLIGLPSSSHRHDPLPGVDVLIGGGWGEEKREDETQGDNFLPGNPYLHETDLERVDLKNGGPYVTVQRTSGKSGRRRLMSAARRAADNDHRLLGLFGVKGGHLPYQTADGQYDPTIDENETEQYSEADVDENPTLAEMTRAALRVLEPAIDGFWLTIEAGDVDWANHANNVDNSIGAVLSGESAFDVVMDWVDENDAWPHTAVIVTADHGHYLVIEDAEPIMQAGAQTAALQGNQNRRKKTN